MTPTCGLRTQLQECRQVDAHPSAWATIASDTRLETALPLRSTGHSAIVEPVRRRLMGHPAPPGRDAAASKRNSYWVHRMTGPRAPRRPRHPIERAPASDAACEVPCRSKLAACAFAPLHRTSRSALLLMLRTNKAGLEDLRGGRVPEVSSKDVVPNGRAPLIRSKEPRRECPFDAAPGHDERCAIFDAESDTVEASVRPRSA